VCIGTKALSISKSRENGIERRAGAFKKLQAAAASAIKNPLALQVRNYAMQY
jgi:hypothetical protein